MLGYKKENSDETQDMDERVLCYQLDVHEPEVWRFFDLTKHEIVDPPPDHDDWVTPPSYNPKFQNGVQKVKFKV